MFLQLLPHQKAAYSWPEYALLSAKSVGLCTRSWLVAKVCGARGERAVNSCSESLCESKTPVLQLVYLALVGYTYKIYNENVFSELPLPGLPLWHM